MPMKPGACTPPPTMPASVENFMPDGVMPGNSRFTIMTPLHIGMSAMMHMKQPQDVIGSFMSE